MSFVKRTGMETKVLLVCAYIRLYVHSIWKKLVPNDIVFTVATFYCNSDSWDKITSDKLLFIVNNDSVSDIGHFICLNKPIADDGIDISTFWVNGFANMQTTKGEYYHWRLRIVSNEGLDVQQLSELEAVKDERDGEQNSSEKIRARLIIGVIQSKNKTLPMQKDFADDVGNGYGFDGANGKIWNGSLFSKSFNTKFSAYYISDTVHVILDLRDINKYLLKFYVNDERRKMFTTEIESEVWEYSLAVSFAACGVIQLLPDMALDDDEEK